MAWSTILQLAPSAVSLVTGLLGSRRASRNANRQYEMMMAQLEDAQRTQERLFGYADLASEDARRRNEELRAFEQFSLEQLQLERAFSMDEMRRVQDQLVSERQFEIDRQVRADQEAARIQAFRLDQLLRNQQLSEEERGFAIRELERVQQIASGERAEDIRRLYEDRARAEAQREFMLGVFREGRDMALDERAMDLDVRDRITGQIGDLQSSLSAAFSAMGAAPQIGRLTEEDIRAEIERRSQQAISDVDRAADRVASINEADLVRSGMDRSTLATERRGDIAERLAQEYQAARSRAYDEALRYIMGREDALTGNANAIMGNRGAQLAEIAGVRGAGLQEMLNLPQVRSALPGLSMAQLVGDGIFNRELTSANNFRAPVDILSRVDAGALGAMTPALSSFDVGRTAAAFMAPNLPSVGGAFSPFNQIIDSPASFLGGAASLSGGQANMLGQLYGQAQTRADAAGAGLGRGMQDFFTELASLFPANQQQPAAGGTLLGISSLAPSTSPIPPLRPA